MRHKECEDNEVGRVYCCHKISLVILGAILFHFIMLELEITLKTTNFK